MPECPRIAEAEIFAGQEKGLIQKTVGKQRQCPRIKHLSEELSAIATTAMGRYKALMCTLDPFPNAKTEAELADRAWNETRKDLGLEAMDPAMNVRSLVRLIAVELLSSG